MAYEETLRAITLNADSSLAVATGVPGTVAGQTSNAGNQYRFVKVTGEHQAGLADADDTDTVVGVLQNKPQATGDAATVGYQGVSKVVCSEAITAGAAIYSTANGRATDTAGAGAKLGIALTATSAADQLVSVLLRLS